jgi:hypothetical protein
MTQGSSEDMAVNTTGIHVHGPHQTCVRVLHLPKSVWPDGCGGTPFVGVAP